MRGRLQILVCLAVGALALLGAGPALAQGGTTTSAGDQQYVDPLSTATATTPASSSASPPPSSSTAPAPSTSGATSSTAGSPTKHAHAGTSSRTLPFTGLNLWILVALGIGLLSGGLLLRRVIRRA